MVGITFYAQDGEYQISAEGHATGSPECCAAVSCMLTALAGWISNNREHVKSSRPPRIELNSGNATILFLGDKYADAAFRLTVIGLVQLAKSYPQYVFCDWVD